MYVCVFVYIQYHFRSSSSYLGDLIVSSDFYVTLVGVKVGYIIKKILR